jgi:two-component sensor histidine kinase
VKDAESAVLSRLRSLAQTHVMLIDKDWQGADLTEVVRIEMMPFADRVQTEGPPLVLNAKAAQNFALALHELATNAAKYGALSVPAGRVEIHWQPVRVSDHKRSVLQIDWIEQEGPAVTHPQQRSFGSKLIERSIAAELGGTARLTFAPEGLHCEIVIPLEKASADFRATVEDLQNVSRAGYAGI